jgi:hypothetical protein
MKKLFLSLLVALFACTPAQIRAEQPKATGQTIALFVSNGINSLSDGDIKLLAAQTLKDAGFVPISLGDFYYQRAYNDTDPTHVLELKKSLAGLVPTSIALLSVNGDIKTRDIFGVHSITSIMTVKLFVVRPDGSTSKILSTVSEASDLDRTKAITQNATVAIQNIFDDARATLITP